MTMPLETPGATGAQDRQRPRRARRTAQGRDVRAGDDPAVIVTRGSRRDALTARMHEELAAGLRELSGVGPAVTIWGSARTPKDHPDYERARALGEQFGRAGLAVITGGGPGTMEAANRGAREAGATSVGLTIRLPFEQHGNAYLDRRVAFRYFSVRKMMFVRHSRAFLVMPGGYGTMDELFELLTLIQCEKTEAWPVILVGGGYWSGLVNWLSKTVLTAGNISVRDVRLLRVVDDPAEAVSVAAAAAGWQARGRVAGASAA